MNRTQASGDWPWIDFAFDLRRLPSQTWIDLGECDSTCDHIAQTPLSPELRKTLHSVYLSKGAHATTAIEGNTLSETQVRELVDSRLKLPPSKAYLAREVENIVNGVNEIGRRVGEQKEPPITPRLLQEYNRMVLSGLEVEDHVRPGEYTPTQLTVHRYRPPRPSAVPGLVERLCRDLPQFDQADDLPPKVRAILKAIFAHLYVAWIHPFGDGNGRTARLLEFDILLRSGVPSPAAHLLSNHYNQTRSEYYRRLDAASRERDAGRFIAYAVAGFRDGLREQLAVVNSYVQKIVWKDYVYSRFDREKPSPTSRRRRAVVLALSNSATPVPAERVHLMTDEINRQYGDKTQKTLTRDLNALVDMELIRVEAWQDGFGYAPNIGIMEARFPMRRES